MTCRLVARLDQQRRDPSDTDEYRLIPLINGLRDSRSAVIGSEPSTTTTRKKRFF